MKKHWKKYYRLPLRYDVHSHYAFTDDNVMALTFGNCTEDQAKRIVDAINGNSELLIYGLEFVDGEYQVNGNCLMMVRGWGYLKGTGARNLDSDKAAEIQDAFAEYIFNRLKAK